MIGYINGKPFDLPADYVTRRMGIIAMTGCGKSYLGGVIAEELLTIGRQTVILDYTGVWYGLRSSKDGQREGFNIVIAGGDHGDIPLEVNSGKVMARAIVNDGFSCVLDLSLFDDEEVLIFIADFLSEFQHRNRKPVCLFCDEADVYAPQKIELKGQKRTLNAMRNIMKRGRVKGIGVVPITQRPAELDKGVLSQCEILATLRLCHPLDIAAVLKWVSARDPFKARDMEASLPTMPIGTAWLWAPNWPTRDGVFGKLQVRLKETFDSGKTPEPGEMKEEPKVLARLDMAKLGESIRATVEKVKAEDPAFLQTRIDELELHLADAKKQPAVDPAPWVPIEIVSQAQSLVEALSKLAPRVVKFTHCETAFDTRTGVGISVPVRSEVVIEPQKPKASARQPEPFVRLDLSKCEAAILAALAQNPPGCSLAKLSLLAGYSKTSSTFHNALASLRSADLLSGGKRDLFRITAAGMQKGPFPKIPNTRAAQREYWLQHQSLGKCERAVLWAMFECGRPVSLDKICQVTNYSKTSSSFHNGLAKLRSLGLIVRAGDGMHDVVEELR